MNLATLFETLPTKFGTQVESMHAEHGDEAYIFLGDPDIRPITEYLRGELQARLVSVFAEDRVSEEGVFFNYYVFEQKVGATHGAKSYTSSSAHSQLNPGTIDAKNDTTVLLTEGPRAPAKP